VKHKCFNFSKLSYSFLNNNINKTRMIIISILFMLGELINAEVIVYSNESYLTDGNIINATEVGPSSICNLIMQTSLNCQPGTVRAYLADEGISPRLFFDAQEPVYFWDGGNYTNTGKKWANETVVPLWYSNNTWLGTDVSGMATSWDCLGWSTMHSLGTDSEMVLSYCGIMKKVGCACLAIDGSLPGTTRSPTLSPTPPSISPTKNPTSNPTPYPSLNPTGPTSLSPTRNPTSGGVDNKSIGSAFLLGVLCGMIWVLGEDKI